RFSSGAGNRLRHPAAAGHSPIQLINVTCMKKWFLISLLYYLCSGAHAQLLDEPSTFSRADSLRGQLTPLRTCYDINYYHLDVRVNPDQKSINGSNLFRFTATTDVDSLQ